MSTPMSVNAATAPTGPTRRYESVPPTRGTYVRRRIAVLAGLVLVVFALTVLIGRVGAEAELADPVAGHVVVAPGQTLWDIAVETADEGVDPREQLHALRQLNETDGAVDVWQTILIPAR